VPSGPARSGYAVQVAAVNARGEADTIARRLAGKGYSAYVEVPKGSTSVFRVRVGTFKTRREAQTVADKLKKEEKFKPWVTR
jgi:cell division septation protein DedD